MEIIVNVKQPGRKHPLINNAIISIADIGQSPTAAALIEAVVDQQVQAYNAKRVEMNILPFLSDAQTQEQAATGKIGFGSIYNENKASPEQARKTALQAFEDGMFALFLDETEITELNTIVHLTDTTVITFIRLTFLAGSYW
jgi:hypothetical protein